MKISNIIKCDSLINFKELVFLNVIWKRWRKAGERPAESNARFMNGCYCNSYSAVFL